MLIGSVPRLRPGLAPRHRLLSVLDGWAGYSVVCLQAPAGFGKTTLAATWVHKLETLPEHARPGIAWASLDDFDDSAEALLRRLHGALEPLHQQLSSTYGLLQAAQIDASQYLEEVRRCCDAAAAPTLIVLDDIHLVRSPDALRCLQMLADRATNGLHLALLSRMRPVIDLVKHTLAGRVLIIDVDELSLDHEEFESLVASCRLNEISTDRRSFIEKKMRGWVAGLQMLIHSLPHSGPLTENAILAAHSREEISAYLDHEMLHPIHEPLLSFLIRVSFLPYLNAPLCAAVTELPVAACVRFLAQAVEATGFIDRFLHCRSGEAAGTPDDEVGFRMHSLLREHLVSHLHRLYTRADRSHIRSRAVQWLAAHDEVESALNLLLLPASAPGDVPGIDDADLGFAADVLESACSSALRRADVGFVMRWLDRLPATLLEVRPRLALDAAWADFHTLRPRLRARLDTAARAISFAQNNAAQTTEFAAEIAVLRALCAAFEGRFDEAERAIQIADAMHDAQLPVPRGYLHLLRAYHFSSHPTPAEDRRIDVAASIQDFRDGKFLRGQVEAFTIAGIIETYYLDGANVVAAYTKGIDFIRMVGWEKSTYGINMHLYIGDALYHQNRIPEARWHFQYVLELARLAESEASTGYFARVYLQLCDLAQGNAPEHGLDDAEDFTAWQAIRTLAAPRLWHAVSYVRMIRNLRLEQVGQCIPDLMHMNLLPERIDEHAVPVSVLTSVAGSFIAGERIMAAADLLERFCNRMDQIGYASMALRGRVLQVLQRYLLGSPDAAVEQLQRILPMVARAGLYRAVLDITPLRSVLRRCNTPLAQRFLSLDGAHMPKRELRPYGLSSQEIAVLRRLTAFDDTRALADDMSISYATVRTHLRNCYRKMNVHSRIAAIEAARAAGLL